MTRMVQAGVMLVAVLSARATLATLGLAQNAKGESYALIVGVRDYQHADLALLRYTENDAEELVKVLDKPESPFHKKDNNVAKEIENSIGMKLVYVPAGKFTMGSSKREQDDAIADYETILRVKVQQRIIDGYRAEGPEHEVEITKGFYMGVYEVTQEEWDKVMGKGKNPSYFSATGKGMDKVKGMDTSRFPVERVSWKDAQDFLDKLNAFPEEKNKGRKYRLPSEAEWEHAARKGRVAKAKETDPFSFGKSLSSTQANFDGNYPYGEAAKGLALGRTCKVGSYTANGLGIHDMHGTVWEWCSDWYGADYYASSPKRDPGGPSTGSDRVCRSGGWYDAGQFCRSASRLRNAPVVRDDFLGLRVVLVPSGGE